MPFIEMPLDEVTEEAPVAQGRYDLQVVKATEEISKAAREEGADKPNMLHVMLVIQSDEYPNAAPMNIWMMYPDGGDWDQLRMREIKRFLYWMNIPFDHNGFNTEDVEGAEGKDIPVAQETLDNGRVVNTPVFDPIPEEGSEAPAEAGEEEAPAEEDAPAEDDTGDVDADAEEEPEGEPEEPIEEPEPAPARRPAPKRAAPAPAARKPATKAAAPAKKPAARPAPRRR